uniref:Reverse transcriptase domain-containing protein n=1 Tax=Rhabditophanes sp. KR3021 TaxID=114890 RepID=A0AC35TNH0_9BILA
MSLSDSVQIEKPINPIILINPIVPTEPLIHTQPIIPTGPTIRTEIITTPEIVQTILPEIITTSKIKETIMPQTTPEIEETSMPEITTTSEIEKTILPENNKITEIKNAVLRIQNILDSPDPNEYIREISSTSSTTTHAPLYLQVPKIDNDNYIFGIATHLDIPAMESTTTMPPPKENNNPVLPKLSKPTEATIEEFTWWKKALAGLMCALNDCSVLERMLKLPPVIHSKGYYEESYMRKML